MCFFPAIFLETASLPFRTTLLPLHCHPVLSPYPATCPPLDSLISATCLVLGVNSPSKYSSITSTFVEYSVLSLAITPPRIVFGYFCYGFTTQRVTLSILASLSAVLLDDNPRAKKTQIVHRKFCTL